MQFVSPRLEQTASEADGELAISIVIRVSGDAVPNDDCPSFSSGEAIDSGDARGTASHVRESIRDNTESVKTHLFWSMVAETVACDERDQVAFPDRTTVPRDTFRTSGLSIRFAESC